ncbi:MAG: outer membrane beta-barrel protein [Alphaproteobacteria bacterium]|nr:outer membrane beta-barrel protein [Alphaproteobacteria bacterium]
MNKPTLTCAAMLGFVALSSAARGDALATPSMAGPLAANPNPFSVDLPDWFGDAGGKIYIGGDVSGLAYVQSNATHNHIGDADTFLDLSNGQVFIQKTDGWLQFFVDAGAYSFPTVGVPYVDSTQTETATFGYVPVAYAKLVGPGMFSSFSIEAGKLPTLIGDEYGFTYQNMNIERGLLWNVEPIVSRGVQLNYAAGPLTVSFSWNDGFYTNVWNSLSGLVSYALNGGADTFAFTAEGNLRTSASSTFFESPLSVGSIYDLIYTHTQGPWTISPYVQYISTPTRFFEWGAQVWGGGLLTSYSFNDNWKLAARGEYESAASHHGTIFSSNIIGYGPESNAWSITVTPTYQWKVFYARADFSYVGIGNIKSGDGFGSNGTATSQVRGMLEAGILF